MKPCISQLFSDKFISGSRLSKSSSHQTGNPEALNSCPSLKMTLHFSLINIFSIKIPLVLLNVSYTVTHYTVSDLCELSAHTILLSANNLEYQLSDLCCVLGPYRGVVTMDQLMHGYLFLCDRPVLSLYFSC